MSFRTVVITSKCKLSYKSGFLIYRGECVKTIHLSEIGTLIIDSTAVVITTYLICELNKNKIKIIFCDENSNPISEVIPYYGSHNTSKRVFEQINWNEIFTEIVWTKIIEKKLENQRDFLKKHDLGSFETLDRYIDELEILDTTNREGLGAKIYFRELFGSDFSRDIKDNVNSALNYGYTVLLSNFNKEIVSKGYLTQIGMKHSNQFNYFNLSCDLMEPFRCVVDEIVYNNKEKIFDHDYKMLLVDMLNKKFMYNGSSQYFSAIIAQYVNNVFGVINSREINDLIFGELLWEQDI